MSKVTLGKTGICVEKNSFGCLPIQRVSQDEAVFLLRRAFEGGMRFFDTARMYSDSEVKVGAAFEGIREQLYIATKSHAKTGEEMKTHLEQSLTNLRTDYIDIYQFHQATRCIRPGDGSGLYEAALEAKTQGKIRHIGITTHRYEVALEAIESGLYETLQYPLCYLANDKDMAVVQACKEAGMGFIAMKALSGGLLTNSAAAYAWLDRFDHVLPIWGVQRKEELDEFLTYIKAPPALDEELTAVIDRDRAQLQGEFCRGCGYCMPCPVGIEINNCARMSLMIRRAPTAAWTDEKGQERMGKIENCLNCGACKAKCPYGLDTPRLLRDNYRDFMEVLAGKQV